MPSASRPAATAATPEPPPPAPLALPEDAAPTQPPAPEWTSWRYVGPDPRTYTNVPVTVAHGDVVSWPEVPADDGHWQPTDEAPTKRPDNHRPDPQPVTAKPEQEG